MNCLRSTQPLFLSRIPFLALLMLASTFTANAAFAWQSNKPETEDIETRIEAVRAWANSLEQQARRREAIGRLFLALRLCPLAWRAFGLYPDDKESAPYRWGRLMEKGRCTKDDPERAIAFLRRATKEDRIAPKAHARLAQSYLEGRGVAKDETTAHRHFRLALLTLGWSFAVRLFKGEDFDPDALFSDFLAPDWIMPEAFEADVAWLHDTADAGDDAVVDMALSYCDQDTPPCANIAFEWISAAAWTLKGRRANYEYARLLLDDAFISARLDNTFQSSGMARDPGVREIEIMVALLRSGMGNYLPAIELLIDLLKSAPMTEERQKALYFWNLRLSQLVKDKNLENLRLSAEALSELARIDVEDVDSYATLTKLPPIRWHLTYTHQQEIN